MTADNSSDDKTQSITVISVGSTVSRYKILGKIGAGGMGEVYLAEDPSLNRKLALKFLPPTLASNEDFRARFMREAQSAASLNHPNVITIHEIADYNGRLFIAMEYLEGRSLSDVITDGIPGLQTTLNIITQISLGLKKAHEADIVHRDIKPDNIYVTNDDLVKILDFGLAHRETDMQLTQDGTVLGTVNYMSPEQGQGLKVDNRSDIFSLGVVFYELLTGRKPFKRSSVPATIHAIVHESPKGLTHYSPYLPPNLQKILDKAMAKSPAQRYQTLGEMLIDIRRLESGQIVSGAASTIAPVAPSSAPAIKSLAVLYLKNLGSSDDEFLSYGITEDLIVDLSRIGNIRVAPMRSIMKWKDSDEELEKLAIELNVDILLDGSIHRTAESIRVSAQLVDASTGENLWAHRWEESVDNLPQIKQALARGISAALSIDHTQAAGVHVGRPDASDPQAYEFYLRGKYIFDHKKDTEDIDVAIELYSQAMRIEPSLVAAKAGLAEALIHKGEFDRANIELISAAADAHKRGLKSDEATILMILAKSHEFQSRWDDAEKDAPTALDILSELGDLAGEAEALGVLIQTFLPRSKFSKSLELYDRVLEINRQLDDDQKAAEALKNMGNTFHRMGKYVQARSLYEEALEIARKKQNRALEAACLSNIGITFFYMSEFDESLRHYEEALKIDMYLDDRTGMATRYNNMAIVHLTKGAFRNAITYFEKAADAYEKLGEQGSFALASNNVAGVLVTLGECDEAIKMSTESLRIAEELDYPMAEVFAHDYLSQALFCQRFTDLALEHARTALQKAIDADLPRNQAFTCSNLGEMYFHLGETKLSREFFDRALKLSNDLKKKETQFKASSYLAFLDIMEGGKDAGIDRLRAIVAQTNMQPDPVYIVLSQRLLGQALLQFGTTEEDSKNGTRILNESLDMATVREIAYEVEIIKKLLSNVTT